MNDNQKITFGQKFAYGLPEGIVQLIVGLVAFYSFYFYSDIMLINPALIGVVFLVVRVLSIFIDPLIGSYLDTHKPSKSGRFTPTMSFGAILYFLATTLIFLAPNIDMSAKVIYFMVTYFLYNLSYSIFEVPYSSILTTLSSDYNELNKTGTFRSLLGAIGIALIGVCIGPILKIFENYTGVISNYTITAAIFGLALLLASFFMRKMIREKVTTIPVEKKEKLSFVTFLKVILTNKPLLIIFIINLLSNTAWLLNNAATIYFFQYILKLPELFIPYIIMTGFAQLPLFVILPKIATKFGNKNSILGATLISIIGFIILFIGMNNVIVVFAASVVAGFGWNVIYGLIFGMTAHSVEYGEWRHGVRTAAVSSSLQLVSFKLSLGLNGFILGLVLAAGKYVPDAAVQSASSILAINSGFIIIPGLMAVLWLIFMLFYDLDKLYPTISKELEERRNIQK